MKLLDFFKKKKKPEKRKVEKKVEARPLPRTKEKAKEEIIKPEIKRAKKKISEIAYRVLYSPHITEKATALTEENKYVFKVSEKSNKIELKNIEQFAFDSSLGRLNQSKSIFKVFEKTDKFLYGKSLLNFFISLGPPRFIWKDKPVINASGNEFGRTYGIIDPDNFQTSVAPTIVGDLYMNFSVWGIIFGMLFFGWLFRIIFDLLIKESNVSLSGVIIYSVFWIQIIKGTEDWIAPVWAGLVKLLVILLIIHFFLATKYEIFTKLQKK